MTQANEQHFTPKPLSEQRPGAWNFVEPPPAHMGAGWQRATAQNWGRDTIISIPEPAMELRIKLSEEARDRLMRCSIFRGAEADLALDEDDWREFEDALTEIMFPPARWVLGVER